MLTNSWFIGIISGIIATVIFNLVINVFGKKEYTNNIKKVNLEVVTLLLPTTIAERIPDNEIIKAILNSTAKKYSVRLEDIISVNQIYNDLIREVYSTNLLSMEKKQSITLTLNELKMQINNSKSDIKSPELYELRRIKLFTYLYVTGISLIFYITYYDKLNGNLSVDALKSLSEYDKLLLGFVTAYTFSFILSRYSEYRISKTRKKRVKSMWDAIYKLVEMGNGFRSNGLACVGNKSIYWILRYIYSQKIKILLL